jgi:hypothetical protein
MTLATRIADALTHYGDMSAAELAVLLNAPTAEVRKTLLTPRFTHVDLEQRIGTHGYRVAVAA